jgi:ribosomal-protein-alanine N-acetyltransferase
MAVLVTTTKGLTVILRRFELRDLKRIIEIEEDSFLDGDEALYQELHEEWPDGFLVAELDGMVIGFLVLVITPDGEGRVFALAMDARYRGKGVGRALLKAAFNTLRKLRIGFVRLEVRVGNQVAQRLYRSTGFMEIGFIPFYYKDGEGALVMRKVL